MTYGEQFLKVSFLFHALTTEEVADTSINYTSAPGWTGAAAALGEMDVAELASIGGYYLTLMNWFKWADYSQLSGVKVAAVGTDGHYLADPLLWEDPSPSKGTFADVLPQATAVLSLRSGFTLGKGNYGRMYLPHTQFALAAGTPYALDGRAAAAAAGAKDFLNSVTGVINDAITAVVFPAIMSQVGGHTTKGVTAVAVSRVTDTQRRRYNNLPPLYSFSELA